MDISDSGEFTRRLIALAELYGAELTPARQALYFEALRDLPFADVAMGLNVAVKTCTWMPKPAEIRKLAVGDSEDRAEFAWLAWKTAARRAGHMASLIVDDAALAETIVAVFGSWEESCALELSAEMWSSKRKEFGRVYRVMSDRALAGSRYLTGQAERNNSTRAEWQIHTPVYRIGTGLEEPRRLTASEAERARVEIAATASQLSIRAAAVQQLESGDEA